VLSGLSFFVAFPRRPDLHFGRQHRIGGRDDSAEEHRGGRHETGHPPAEQGRSGDGERHRDCEQPPGGHPGSPPRRTVELQPGPHERDDHCELGQPLGELSLFQRMGRLQTERQSEGGEAKAEQHHGRRKRFIREQAWQHRRGQHCKTRDYQQQVVALQELDRL
jgi:hypothetical protein